MKKKKALLHRQKSKKYEAPVLNFRSEPNLVQQSAPNFETFQVKP